LRRVIRFSLLMARPHLRKRGGHGQPAPTAQAGGGGGGPPPRCPPRQATPAASQCAAARHPGRARHQLPAARAVGRAHPCLNAFLRALSCAFFIFFFRLASRLISTASARSRSSASIAEQYGRAWRLCQLGDRALVSAERGRPAHRRRRSGRSSRRSALSVPPPAAARASSSLSCPARPTPSCARLEGPWLHPRPAD
jgi:hypothetical protein